MLKLTKTGIGLLTKQYRSVLRKCLLLNLGIFALTATNIIIQQNAYALTEGNASGHRATAVGIDSIATGQSSSSFGDNAKAYGYHTLSLGAGARADNSLSVALGAFSTASEDHVISIGHKSTDLNWYGSSWGADYFRRIVNVADGINAHDAVTLGQMNNALNYYYTKTEADARYAKLSGDNIFTLPVGRIEFLHDADGGIIRVVNSEGKTSTHIGNQSDDDGYLNVFSHTGSARVSLEGETEGGSLQLYSGSNVVTTQLTSSSFKLNGSSSATGIDFATNVTAGTTNASHLATTGAVNQLLNYYYTFRVDERAETTEFALFLDNEKLSNVFEA